MIGWTKLLGLLALAGTGLAAIFRAKSKQHQAEAREQKSRVDQADSVVQLHQRVNENRWRKKAKHQQEHADANSDPHRRDDLDNSW